MRPLLRKTLILGTLGLGLYVKGCSDGYNKGYIRGENETLITVNELNHLEKRIQQTTNFFSGFKVYEGIDIQKQQNLLDKLLALRDNSGRATAELTILK